MKKALEKVKKYDTIFYGVAIIILALSLLMPKSGSLVLLDELFEVLIIGIACAYVIYKLLCSRKPATSSQKKGRIIVAICCVVVGLIFSKNVVQDFINGTENVYLSNVETSRYQGTAGILASHYYLIGTDENGDRIRLEISSEDYSELSNRNSVEIEYYKFTERVVGFR